MLLVQPRPSAIVSLVSEFIAFHCHLLINLAGGLEAEVFGTNMLNNQSGIIDPIWTCLVDGNAIAPEPFFQFPENNWRFCYFNNLTSGKHTVAVSVSSNGHSFYFDRLSYRPARDSKSIVNDSIIVDFEDADLSYDSSWSPFSEISMMTKQNGATLTFPFVGSCPSY